MNDRELREELSAAYLWGGMSREALRTDYPPWFDHLTWGPQGGASWRDLLRDLAK